VLLKVGDNVSTDEILPAGASVLPLRSNVPAISRFCFKPIDKTYPDRAEEVWPQGGHVIVAGENYGQGSSREHAALAPRHLGLRVVLARSFARIHWQNLVNFGVLPLTIEESTEKRLSPDDVLRFVDLHQLRPDAPVYAHNVSQQRSFEARHTLSDRQIRVLNAGGIINWIRER
jgi:aconitate hydratase